MTILSVLFTVLVVGYSVIMIANRFLSKSGLKIKKFYEEKEYSSYTPTRKECLFIMGLAILLRIGIFVLSIIIHYTMKDSIGTFSWETVINNWGKWDAEHYIMLTDGYDSYQYEHYGEYFYPGLVFFPLFPFILKVFKIFIPNAIVAGMVASTIMFAIACVYLYKLVAFDYGKEIAEKTLILLCTFPFSFFFGGVMSESTFLLFTVLTLYCIRKHYWPLVGIFGSLSALSRYVGVFLVFPAFVEICEEYKALEHIKELKYLFKNIVMKCLPLLFIPCGTLIFLEINYVLTGDALYFLEIHRVFFCQGYRPFVIILARLYELISTSDWLGDQIMNWGYAMLMVIFQFLALFSGSKKHRTMYMIWFLCYLIINTSINFPISTGRYASCAIPLFIIIAEKLEGKPTLTNIVYIISTGLFTLTFAEFFIFGNIM